MSRSELIWVGWAGSELSSELAWCHQERAYVGVYDRLAAVKPSID